MAQVYRQVYTENVAKLVRCLPMDDPLFIAALSTKNLLPGNTQSHIKSLPTQADKSSYFLTKVIKTPLDIDDTTSFDTLLNIMEKCEYAHVRTLATQIRAKIAAA